MNRNYITVGVIVLSILAVGAIDSPINHEDMSATSKYFSQSEKMQKLTSYYAKHNSPCPEVMARATAQAKRPRLMAAIAVTESNGKPWAIGKAGEVGAWQVIPKLHGDVHPLPEYQIKQAEALMDDLLAECGGRISKALSLYNGDRSGRYARKVLAKLNTLEGEL